MRHSLKLRGIMDSMALWGDGGIVKGWTNHLKEGKNKLCKALDWMQQLQGESYGDRRGGTRRKRGGCRRRTADILRVRNGQDLRGSEYSIDLSLFALVFSTYHIVSWNSEMLMGLRSITGVNFKSWKYLYHFCWVVWTKGVT